MLRVGTANVQPRSAPQWMAFVRRLAELGYSEGRNFTYDHVQIPGTEAWEATYREVVARKPDIVVAAGPELSLKSALAAADKLPVVMIAVDYDPIARGYVTNLARPDGNVTGVYFQNTELAGKHLQLLKEAFPDMTAATVFWDRLSADYWAALQVAAPQLGIRLAGVEFRDRPYDYARAIVQVAPDARKFLLAQASPFFFLDRVPLAEIALQHRAVTMFATRKFGRRGGPDELRGEPDGHVRARRQLRRSNRQGRETRRSGDRAADEIRTDHQPEDREGVGRHDPAVAPRPRRRGDRMKRRTLVATLGGAALVWPRATRAQHGPMPVIGFLGSASAAPWEKRLRAFHQGLGETGYIEGKNVAIEYRWAETHVDRLPALAAELAQRRVDVIAVIGGVDVDGGGQGGDVDDSHRLPHQQRSGRDGSRRQPEPAGRQHHRRLDDGRAGRAQAGGAAARHAAGGEDLRRPRQSDQSRQHRGRRAPHPGGDPGARPASSISSLPATTPSSTPPSPTLARLRPDGLVIAADLFLNTRTEKVAALAALQRLPTISPYREFTESGGLMSYGGGIVEGCRVAGTYVGRVLKGAKPGDLPVLLVTKLELTINLKTAKALGLAVPSMLTERADEVIE